MLTFPPFPANYTDFSSSATSADKVNKLSMQRLLNLMNTQNLQPQLKVFDADDLYIIYWELGDFSVVVLCVLSVNEIEMSLH